MVNRCFARIRISYCVSTTVLHNLSNDSPSLGWFEEYLVRSCINCIAWQTADAAGFRKSTACAGIVAQLVVHLDSNWETVAYLKQTV